MVSLEVVVVSNMPKTDRCLAKMFALAKQKPQLPLFPNTHLLTFHQHDQNNQKQS